MFDDLITKVFAKGPKGGPRGSGRGSEGAHRLISGHRGGPQGGLERSWGGPRASLGATGGQEAMDLIAYRGASVVSFNCF